MELLIALIIGGLYAGAIFLLLQPSPVKLIIGLSMLSNAVNLLIFVSGGLTRGQPPLIEAGELQPSVPYADPLPQALILTAIVIAFGVLAFTLVLFRRASETVGIDNLDDLRVTEQ